MKDEFIYLVEELYGNEFAPLYRHVFDGNEKQYLVDCIDSNFVSSVGKKLLKFSIPRMR